jgi:Zn finger protein HypA/HybF involved in hydrogenase expression
MKCENCPKEYDIIIYGSGRFCSEKCARGFSTKSKRIEINQKVSTKLKGRKTSNGGFKKGYDWRRDLIPHNGSPHTQEEKEKISSGLNKFYQNRLIILLKTEKFETFSKSLRKSILIKERGNKCECCGLDSWIGEPISIHLDHKDGNNSNNQKENLRLLCPNCHSLTPTWRGRNISKKISKEEFQNALQKSINIHQALKSLGLNPAGGNYKTARKRMASVKEIKNSMVVPFSLSTRT